MNPKSGKNCVDELSDSSPIWDIEASSALDGTNQFEIALARGVFAMLVGCLCTQMDEQQTQLVDGALGRLPTGCYLMTAAHDGVRSGMLVHSVLQCCDEPMLISVAARKGHKIDPLIRDSRSFAIGIVEPSDKLVTRRFRSTDSVPTEYLSGDEDDPFDAVETQKLVTGSPILMRCTTWFDCEVLRRIDLESEMELFVGVVVAVMHNNERVQIERDASLNGLD